MSLRSEQMTVAAPMSYVGSYRRLRNWIKHPALWWTLGVVLLVTWWSFDTIWYVCFGVVLLVPYRLLRRGSRKRKIRAAQHREMMEAVDRRP